MGLSLNEAMLLREWVERHGLGGRIATLGVPALHFTAADFARAAGEATPGEVVSASRMPVAELYARLGFTRAAFIDISDHEGADILFDLGRAELPAEFEGAFDTVFDCGTLEHVFHLPHALHNVVAMAAPGGHVLHLVLMANGVDHGFYQLSPTLFFDWFDAAGLQVLEAAALTFDATQFQTSGWSVRHVRRGTFGGGELGVLDGRTSLFMVLARKSAPATGRPAPVQYFYSRRRGPPTVEPRWFPAFEMAKGVITSASRPVRARVSLIRPDAGRAWHGALPPEAPEGSDSSARCRSDLLLLEDGRPLGPLNWAHAAIRDEGGGAYLHWGRDLIFSTSDDSSPLSNGRSYEVLFAGPPLRAGEN